MDGERESSESALTRFQGQRLQGWERPNSQGQKEDSSLDPRTHFRTVGCSLLPCCPSEEWPEVFLMQPYFRANGSLRSMGAGCRFLGCLQAGVSQGWF